MQEISVTTAVSLAEHPSGDVTVRTYVPPAETVGVAVFPPETIFPFEFTVAQLNCAEGVEEEPFNFAVGASHVIAWSIPALTFGGTENNYGLYCTVTPL